MSFLEILLVALSLAMDAFAVCLGAGASPYLNGHRPVFRLAFHFGLFQSLMPVLGWLAGVTIAGLIAAFDHWIAFGLLAFVGIRMLHSGLNPNGEAHHRDISRGWLLVTLAIAVSIDAFAIGLSLAFLDVSIWLPVLIIGLVTSLMSWAGMRIGNRLSKRLGQRAEILGGIILICLGIRILISHLSG
jgi:putative Mn2+ efflux pump MntP